MKKIFVRNRLNLLLLIARLPLKDTPVKKGKKATCKRYELKGKQISSLAEWVP